MQITSLIMLLLFTTLIYLPAASSKEACIKHLHKLQKIQAIQRQGHSLKQSRKLKSKEDKARKVWWNCTKQPSASILKKRHVKASKKSSTKIHSKKKRSAPDTVLKKNKPQEILSKKSTFTYSNGFTPAETYQGNKKLAWLKFYQQPEQCLKAKKLKLFVFCVEDRLDQKRAFEIYYKRSVVEY